jgi:hypothetical protein
MASGMTGDRRPSRVTTRRGWLAAVLATGVGLGLRRTASGADAVEKEVAELEELGRKAGLGPFRSSVTEHYLGIGNAPDDYRTEALHYCEALATAYIKYFEDKKFAVELPAQKLTAVILKDRASYVAFLGQAPGASVGGHYDLDTNRLVIFDFRPEGAALKQAGVKLERINSITLSHETTHQLTYNTGLLDRTGDVPLAVTEGLAMYAELWRPGVKSALGMINRPRLLVLVNQANQGQDWIPLEKLLTDDDLFEQPATEQLACAEGWVFVHYALRTTAALPRFRKYVDRIRPRRDGSQRLVDATAELGDLGRLDTAVRKHVRFLKTG